MGRKLALVCQFVLAETLKCNCALNADEMDGFDAKVFTSEELRVLLFNAIIPPWDYYFRNPIYKYPHLWTIGRIIRRVLSKEIAEIDFEIKADVFDILAIVRFNLGHPISIGRFCALLAWCANLCKKSSNSETWTRCGEIANALKKHL